MYVKKIAEVVQFTKDEKYAKFTRIVFDTAPTGHTLRLLSLPEFLDKSIGKIVRLRQKLTSAGDMVKGLFGQENQNQDAAVEKLENLKKRWEQKFLDKSLSIIFSVLCSIKNTSFKAEEKERD